MGKLNRRKFCLFCGKRILGKGNYCRGHNANTKPQPIPNDHECECGCGELVASNRRFKKGHNKGMLGKHPTEETLVKMRAPKSEEFKQNLSRVNMGHIVTEETKVKLRGPKAEEHKQNLRHPRSKEGAEANKIAHNIPSAIENNRKAGIRRYEDPLERIKQAERTTISWKDPEIRANQALAIKNGWSNQDLRNRQSEIQLVVQNRPKQKEILSRKTLQYWSDPVWKTNQILAIGKGQCRRPNKPETLIHLITKEYFTGWKYTGDYSIVIAGKNPDFINFETKQIIEFYGDYWHRDEDPTIKAESYYQAGYELCVIWEHELQDLDEVIMKLRRFCGTNVF